MVLMSVHDGVSGKTGLNVGKNYYYHDWFFKIKSIIWIKKMLSEK